MKGGVHSFTAVPLLSSVLVAGHTTPPLREFPVGGRETDQS